MLQRFCWNLLLCVVAAGLLGGAASAQEKQTLWRIGEFDRSSNEFHFHDLDYANPASDAVYTVGKSATNDWPRFQPGPANGMCGGRLHPFTIVFQLDRAPKGSYTLDLAVLYETPRLSHLKLEINGHSGLFYFHPKLDYVAGDWEGTFVPQTSYDRKAIAIPAAFLKKGENRLVLTALDTPAAAQHSLGSIAPGHTGLVYDALALMQVPQTEAAPVQVAAEPSIFYKQREGRLREIVDVFVDSPRAVRSVAFKMGGHREQQPVEERTEFGEHRFSFAVPEWSGAQTAQIAVEEDGGRANVRRELTPAKKWNIAVVPHEHLDVGFTDYPAKVAELHAQSIDDAMAILKRHPEFRWTLDGEWVAEQYLAARSPEAQKEFLDRVRDGAIVIPPEYANQHTGNTSLEGLIRSYYNGRALAHRFDLPRPASAQTVDVPSYTWTLPSVLHDAGIRYFVGASNSWRAPIMLHGRWNEHSPFYWEGPDGGRVLMWYSRAYLQMHTLFGSPWQAEAVRDALPVFLQAYTRPDYTASTAMIFGSQLENTPLAKEQAELQSAWNAQFAYPRIEFSTTEQAMARIEREAEGKFPVVRGDLGPYWEDGYGSDAIHTAVHRENQERILTAEKLSVLPPLFAPALRPWREELQRAWQNELVYDEHTWTYVGATSQPEAQQTEEQTALKQSRVLEARRGITETIQRSWSQLGSLLAPEQNSIAVFNALSWARSGLVEIDLPEGTEIFDTKSAQTVPYEVVFQGKGYRLPGFGAGYRRVRFLAVDVPAVGYKLFALRAAKDQPVADVSPEGAVLENAYYRIVLDPATAAARSILDKQTGNELVDSASPYGFGALLYVTGAKDYPNNSLYRYGASMKPPALTIHSLRDGRLLRLRRTSYGQVAEMEAYSETLGKVRVEITLRDRSKQIDVRVTFHKERILDREAAYVAFPVRAQQPVFRYGNQTGWVNPARDELAGGSREWYVARHWFSVEDSAQAVTITPLDAPLVTFGDIVRGEWPKEFTPKSSTAFSWLLNNYWGTNFPAWQGGDFSFRYAITSGNKLNPVQAERFGLEAMTPLEYTNVAAASGSGVLPSTAASLLEVSGADVVLSTWKPAENGDGSVLRLQELAGKSGTVHVKSNFVEFRDVRRTDILEDNRAEIATRGGEIEVAIEPYQVLTLRVHPVARTKNFGEQEKP